MIATLSVARAEAGKISGNIYCTETSKPLSGTTVILILPGPYNLYAITDENGCYEFNDVAPGTYTLFTSSLTHSEQKATVTVYGSTGPAAGMERNSPDFYLEVDYMRGVCDGPWG